MTAARGTTAEPPEAWTKTLAASRDRVLAAARAGRHGEALLTHATAGRIVAAWTLDPAPVDPVTHLEQAHARGRRHLRRLLDQPLGAEVRSPMTNQLFDRLTQPADPAQRKKIDYTSVDSYTYTPRKPLRRVLDHTLDHLNQIDQWERWRRDGVVPTPTDGWVPSTVTLPEDRLALTAGDLDGWLWRIDQAMRLLTQRAAAQPRRARLAAARRRMAAPTRPPPRRSLGAAVRRVLRRGAARRSGRPLRGGRRSFQRAPRRVTRARRRLVDRLSRSLRHVLPDRGRRRGGPHAGTRSRHRDHVASP